MEKLKLSIDLTDINKALSDLKKGIRVKLIPDDGDVKKKLAQIKSPIVKITIKPGDDLDKVKKDIESLPKGVVVQVRAVTDTPSKVAEIKSKIGELPNVKNLNVNVQTGMSIARLGFLGAAITGVGTLFTGLTNSIRLLQSAMSNSSEFESITARLNALYGSADKAKIVFENFKEVAMTTPFELKDVASAGAQLKAFGLDAEQNIKQLADLAAFMGTDMATAASA
jgi:hypothetical protein